MKTKKEQYWYIWWERYQKRRLWAWFTRQKGHDRVFVYMVRHRWWICLILRTLCIFLGTLEEGGFGISRVADLANVVLGFRVFPKKSRGFLGQVYSTGNGFCHVLARVSGIVVKMCGFSGFKLHKGYQFVKFLQELLKLRSSGLSGLTKYFSGFSGFTKFSSGFKPPS